VVKKPAISGAPGINKNFIVTQDSSPWDIFEVFSSPEMFKHMQKETNWFAKQQINKKKQEGYCCDVAVQCYTAVLCCVLHVHSM
jgi:hypothetical protein